MRMCRRDRKRLASAILAIMFVSSAANVQFVAKGGIVEEIIAERRKRHISEAACLLGNYEFSERAIEATRVEAEARFRAYLRLASAGNPADVSSVLGGADALSAWSRDGKLGDVLAVDDPLARGLAVRPEAAKMWQAPVIAGDRKSALVVWRVGSPNSEYPAGWYRGRFARTGLLDRIWRLVALEVQIGGAVPEIAGYCHVIGDGVKLNVRMPGIAKYLKDNRYMSHKWTAKELREVRGPAPADWPVSLGGREN